MCIVSLTFRRLEQEQLYCKDVSIFSIRCDFYSLYTEADCHSIAKYMCVSVFMIEIYSLANNINSNRQLDFVTRRLKEGKVSS